MGLGGCNKDLSVKGWESICRATRHSATLSSLQLDASFLDKFKVRPSAGSVCHWSDLKRGLCIAYHAACTFSCITYIWVLFTYVLEYICIFVFTYNVYIYTYSMNVQYMRILHILHIQMIFAVGQEWKGFLLPFFCTCQDAFWQKHDRPRVNLPNSIQ